MKQRGGQVGKLRESSCNFRMQWKPWMLSRNVTKCFGRHLCRPANAGSFSAHIRQHAAMQCDELKVARSMFLQLTRSMFLQLTMPPSLLQIVQAFNASAALNNCRVLVYKGQPSYAMEYGKESS